MSNQAVRQMAKNLRKASNANEAPIWRKLSELALKPSIARRNVNLNKIDKITKEGAVVVVPGKVLGTGSMSHKITLCSFSISNAAAGKILESGSKIISFESMVKQYPTGKGVLILG